MTEEEKMRPYTEEEIKNFVSVYMSIRVDETVNILAKGEIFKIPIGQPDLLNIMWDGGIFDNAKSEMLVFDIDASKDRVLTVQQKLARAILDALTDNDLKLKDLRTGKIRFRINREDKYKWNVEIVDKNFKVETEIETENKSGEIKPDEIDSEKLKFSIFKILRDNGTMSIDEIKNKCPEILGSKISEVLDEMAFMDRKIVRFEDNGVLMYRVPG